MSSGEKRVGKHILQKSASVEQRTSLMDAYSSGVTAHHANPMPEGSASPNEKFVRERQRLLDVFPEEIWGKIFEKVEDPKTLESLSNSSLFLRELLSHERVLFLFPTVLDIAGQNYNNFAKNGKESYEADKNPISWLLGSDVCPLKLRSVCQSWNKTIDNLIDNHPLHFYLQEDVRWLQSQNSPKLKSLIDNVFFVGGNREELFHEKFDSTHGGNAHKKNPFLGRSITISFGEEDEEGELFPDLISEVQNILENYGHHVWYCTVSLVDICRSETPFISVVGQFLQLMPNLKVFRFHDKPLCPAFQEQLDEMENQVNLNPLPTLRDLQMLITSELPFSVFQELIRSNGNTIVTLDVLKRRIIDDYAIETVPLPRLASLSLHPFYEVDVQHFNDPRVNWALTRLRLEVLPLGNDIFDAWESTFNVINNKFADTLTYLHLVLPPVKKPQAGQVSPRLRLNFPHLRDLVLNVENLVCLDYMLPTRDSLVYLELFIKLSRTSQRKAFELVRKAERGNGRIVKFFSCERGTRTSNIWKLFPKLKEILFMLETPDSFMQWHCTKQMWEKAKLERDFDVLYLKQE